MDDDRVSRFLKEELAKEERALRKMEVPVDAQR
jgi:hypothetical protein